MLQAQKAADEARARAQMEAAIGGGGGGGASWGLLGPDAEWEEGEGPGGEGPDWRLYVQKHTLTDKQQKTLDKIRWVAGADSQQRAFVVTNVHWWQCAMCGCDVPLSSGAVLFCILQA